MPRTVDFAAILQCLNDNNPKLTTLDLSDQDLKYYETSALTQALENNTSLQFLNLSNNYWIIAYDALNIARVLENNTSLKSLNLRETNICTDVSAYGRGKTNGHTDIGIFAIAKALEENISLESLDISDNYISSSGNQALSQALEKNTSLLSLNLSDNCNLETLDRINKNLERNLQLKKHKESRLAKNLLCLLHEKSLGQSPLHSRLSTIPIDLLHLIFQSTGFFHHEQKDDLPRNILFAHITALLAYRQTLSSVECKTAEWIQWKNEKQKVQFKFTTIIAPSLPPSITIGEESKDQEEETPAIRFVKQCIIS